VVYTAAATDVAGGAVSFSLTGADAGAFTIDPTSGAVSFNSTPVYATQSAYSVNIVASDGTITSSQALSVDITPGSVAATPQMAPATEGGALVSVDALATASSSNPSATLSVTNVPAVLPAGLAYNPAAHSFSFDPANPAYLHLAQGVHQLVSVTYDVTDGAASTPTTVTFDVAGTNEAPMVTAQTASAMQSGAAVVVNALATAADVDDATTLAVVNVPVLLPAGLSYNVTTHSFSFDPTNAAYQNLAPGAHQLVGVTYDVTDGMASTPTTVTFDVMGTNQAPTITADVRPDSLPAYAPAGPVSAASSQPASGSTAPLPRTQAPVGVMSSDFALKLPVDNTVPASYFTHSTGLPPVNAGSFQVAAAPDLNALPPTAAGPDDALGFPVAWLSPGEAVVLGGQRASLSGETYSLFVFEGIPNMRLGAAGMDTVRVPEDAFAHTDPAAIVHLEARMADGRALPAWLKFDGVRGVFSGIAPEGISGPLELEVIARDTQGREARTSFVLLVEDLRAARARQATEGDIPLGLDVDKKEAEKARLEGRRSKPEGAPREGRPQTKEPAASFTEQLRAVKASRDPLLEKIANKESTKPRQRR